MMKIYCEKDYEAMSRRAANIMAAEIIRKPDCILGLATGSTPVGAYTRLSEMCADGDVNFKEVRTVNLDEYKGLAPTHDQSYRYFMQTNFFDKINIDPANTHVPNGLAEDADAECAAYDKMIESMGYADLQLLGIGNNGHIGFNEPADCFIKPTHVVDRTESTIQANSRFFESANDGPRQALTMGIGCIMAARRILIIASGAGKADAMYDAICGNVDPKCQASILQFHNDVVVVADEAALSKVIAAGVPVCK